MKLKAIVISAFFFIISFAYAGDTTNVSKGKYDFIWFRDDSTYISYLSIAEKNKIIYNDSFDMDISNIDAKDLDDDGKTEYLMDLYTGGAHCCTEVYAYHIVSHKLIPLDTILLGNSEYELKDIDSDGKYELVSSDDRFAYAFTSYAGTFFGTRILNFENGRFYQNNRNFEDIVLKNIKGMKKELNSYVSEYRLECPADDTTDTWGTTAGDVKAMLAAIALDYSTIGRTGEGIDYIKKIYKCPDLSKFIEEVKSAIQKR